MLERMRGALIEARRPDEAAALYIRPVLGDPDDWDVRWPWGPQSDEERHRLCHKAAFVLGIVGVCYECWLAEGVDWTIEFPTCEHVALPL